MSTATLLADSTTFIGTPTECLILANRPSIIHFVYGFFQSGMKNELSTCLTYICTCSYVKLSSVLAEITGSKSEPQVSPGNLL